MEKEREILLNKIKCKKCKDEITSIHRHDFKYCKCGLVGVDGGFDYLRRYGDLKNIEDQSVLSTDRFEKIRENICRGGRGKNGDEPLTYIPIAKMSNDWIKNVIEYEEEYRPENIYLKYFKKELEFRKINDIFVEDK